jgi:DNA-binding response OmpR family regulator
MSHIEDEEVHKKFLEAGASEVLPKTMAYEEILAAVRRLGDEL